MVWAPGLPVPIRTPSGKAYVSRIVLYETIGEGPVPCHWCRRPLQWLPKGSPGGIEADHLDRDVSNDDPANVVASCRRCNTVRGHGMLWWVLRYRYWRRADHAEVLRWGPIKKRFACGHQIVEGNVYYARRSRTHECLRCRHERGKKYYRQALLSASEEPG